MVISEDFRNYAGVAQQGLQLLFLKYGRDRESAIAGMRRAMDAARS